MSLHPRTCISKLFSLSLIFVQNVSVAKPRDIFGALEEALEEPQALEEALEEALE